MKLLHFVSIMAIAAPVLAQAVEEQKPAGQPESIFQLGPGLLISDKAQKGVDTTVLPIPMVYYKQGRFSLFGTQANWGFYQDNGTTVAAVGKLRNEGYEKGDSSTVENMSDRRMTFEAGMMVSQEFGWGKLAAEWTSDVLNEHKGHEIRLTVSRRFADAFGVEKLAITPSVGGNWRSKQLNDYYYGVERDEATAWRPAYNVGSTVGLLTAVGISYPLNDKWDLFSSVGVEWFDSEISDSPIVDQHYRMSVLLGAMYTF